MMASEHFVVSVEYPTARPLVVQIQPDSKLFLPPQKVEMVKRLAKIPGHVPTVRRVIRDQVLQRVALNLRNSGVDIVDGK